MQTVQEAREPRQTRLPRTELAETLTRRATLLRVAVAAGLLLGAVAVGAAAIGVHASGGAPESQPASFTDLSPAFDSKIALDTDGYEIVNYVGGILQDASLADSVAYVPAGHRLRAIDLSSPTPQEIWTSEMLSARIELIDVAQGRVYVVTSDDTLHVLDVDADGNSVVLGRVAIGHDASRMVVHDGQAFLTCDQTPLLLVIDVWNLDDMRVVATADVTGWAMARLGNRLIVGGKEALAVYDISAAGEPRMLCLVPLAWRDTRASSDLVIARVGARDIVVAVTKGWFITLELNDLGALTHLAMAEAPQNHLMSIAAIGKHVLMVAPDDSLLTVYDIGEPDTPRQIANVDRPTRPARYARSVVRAEASTGTAIVTDGVGIVHVVDISNPESPSFTVDLDLPRTPSVFAAIGPHWLASDADGLTVYDSSAPHDLRAVADVALSGEPAQGVVYRDVAYVPTGDTGVAVIDVSEPVNPRLLTTIPEAESAWPTRLVSTFGHHLCVADGPFFEAGRWGLRIYDITEPHEPALSSRVPLTDPPSALWSERDLLTVFTSAGPMIQPTWVNLDVSNPVSPTMQLYHREWRWRAGFARDERTAYIGNVLVGLSGDISGGHIGELDVSDPTTVTLRSATEVADAVLALALDGDVLWAGTSTDSDKDHAVVRLDVSELGTPRVVDSFPLSDRVDAIRVVDEHVLVTTERDGMIVVKPPRMPPETPAPPIALRFLPALRK